MYYIYKNAKICRSERIFDYIKIDLYIYIYLWDNTSDPFSRKFCHRFLVEFCHKFWNILHGWRFCFGANGCGLLAESSRKHIGGIYSISDKIRLVRGALTFDTLWKSRDEFPKAERWAAVWRIAASASHSHGPSEIRYSSVLVLARRDWQRIADRRFESAPYRKAPRKTMLDRSLATRAC